MLLAGASPCATSAFLTLWSADFERCCEPRQPGVERQQLLQARRCTRSRFVVAAMVAMLVGIIPELLHSACAWCAPAVPAAAATAELHTGLVHLRDRTAVYLSSSHLAIHRAAQARCSASRKRTQACARMRVAIMMMCLVTSFVFKRLSRSVFFARKVFCFVRSTVKGQSLVRLFPALPDVVTACSEKLQKNA